MDKQNLKKEYKSNSLQLNNLKVEFIKIFLSNRKNPWVLQGFHCANKVPKICIEVMYIKLWYLFGVQHVCQIECVQIDYSAHFLEKRKQTMWTFSGNCCFKARFCFDINSFTLKWTISRKEKTVAYGEGEDLQLCSQELLSDHCALHLNLQGCFR